MGRQLCEQCRNWKIEFEACQHCGFQKPIPWGPFKPNHSMCKRCSHIVPNGEEHDCPGFSTYEHAQRRWCLSCDQTLGDGWFCLSCIYNMQSKNQSLQAEVAQLQAQLAAQPRRGTRPINQPDRYNPSPYPYPEPKKPKIFE